MNGLALILLLVCKQAPIGGTNCAADCLPCDCTCTCAVTCEREPRPVPMCVPCFPWLLTKASCLELKCPACPICPPQLPIAWRARAEQDRMSLWLQRCQPIGPHVRCPDDADEAWASTQEAWVCALLKECDENTDGRVDLADYAAEMNTLTGVIGR